MRLCITEKPSVGKDIASILGANIRREGYFEGNGWYVTWTFGHLCTLKEPEDYNTAWKRWSIGTLPMLPERFGIKLINDTGIQRQFNVIKTLIGKAEEVINCGDAGQEGELIQRWVMQKAGCNVPVKRLWISSLTDEAIREGFRHLRPHEDLDPLYTAGLCRAIGDWILGLNATRLYTLRYGLRGTVLSIGRVQTPTLALVVKRQLEIDHFVPENYWELKTLYRDVTFSAQGKTFRTEEDGKSILDEVRAHSLEIIDVSKKKGREAPPRLFDLTSLQVECNRRLGLSADDTLRTIQSLYEKKVATYPRVDTTYLTDDIYPKCKDILNNLREFHTLLGQIRGQKLRKSKKVFDNSKVTDHHAIIPTGIQATGLSDREASVFRLIAIRFISVFFPDCEYEQTSVKARAGKVQFKAGGRVILNPGWKQLYSKYESETEDNKQGDESENATLPVFKPGESGPHVPRLAKKTTQPPKHYTEGTLLKAMETAGASVDDEELRESLKANGIGRPSTRAAIIEILYKRGYIRRERKSIRATQAGIDLIELIDEELLKSAKLTGIWERRLREIERQKYSATEFVEGLKKMISDITVNVLRDNSARCIGRAEENTKKSRSRKR